MLTKLFKANFVVAITFLVGLFTFVSIDVVNASYHAPVYFIFDSDQGGTKEYDSTAPSDSIPGQPTVEGTAVFLDGDMQRYNEGIMFSSGKNVTVTHTKKGPLVIPDEPTAMERVPLPAGIREDALEEYYAVHPDYFISPYVRGEVPQFVGYYAEDAFLTFYNEKVSAYWAEHPELVAEQRRRDEEYRQKWQNYFEETHRLQREYETSPNGTFTFAVSDNPEFETVTANAYKVGDKTYIDANGLNANNQKIRNVADGEISATSTDAVTGRQLYATNQRINDQFDSRINELGENIDKVGAGAAALAGLHPLDFDSDNKFNVAVAGGFYKDKQAVALGAFYHPNEETMFSVASTIGNNNNMVNLGASFKMGQTRSERKFKEQYKTAPISTVYTLEKRLEDTKSKIASLEEENKNIEAKLDRLLANVGA